MSFGAPTSRPAGSDKSFSAGGSGSRGSLEWRPRVLLTVFPLFIFAGALAFGVDQTISAQVFVLALSMVFLIALATPVSRKQLIRIPGVWWPLGLYVLVLAFAVLSLSPYSPSPANPAWAPSSLRSAGSINVSATIYEIIKLGGLLCAFLVGVMQGSRRRWLRASLDGLLAVGALYAIVSLVMFQGGVQVMAGPRLSGGFLSANTAATVFGMLSILSLSEISRALSLRDTWRAWIAAALMLLFAFCLILTASRVGLAVSVLAGLVFLVWDGRGERRPRQTILVLAAGAIAIAGVVFLMRHDLVLSRSNGLGTDLAVRMEIFRAHWAAFQQSPLTGFGLGSFTDLNNAVMTPENFAALSPVRAAHNVYLQWLEEAGVLGATPMFLLIGLLVLGGIVAGSNPQQAGVQTIRGVTCMSLLVLLHGATDFALQIMPVAALWSFMLGLQFALRQSSGASRHRVAHKPY